MKTQAQINGRLDAYRKGTVDSPYRVKTWRTDEPGWTPMEPGSIDVDLRYNAQCMDLPLDYVLWLTDNKIRLWGNAKDAIHNTFPSGWKVVENKPSTVPKRGWIGVNTIGTFAEYGHIYIVDDPGNTSHMKVLEQNWDGNANKKPSNRWDNYYGCTHFIVPPVAPAVKTVATKKSEAPKSVTKKATAQPKIEVIDKHITGYNMTKRGHNPKGVVIHNDASVGNYKTYYNSLVNAGYDRLANGIAHCYADRHGIWHAIDESRIAWHVADGVQPGSGNFEYYGIEVDESMKVTDKEFLANEQVALQEAARLLKKWKLPANRNTVRLHNEFSSTSCPHRSLKLHAGLDPQHQAITETARLKLKDYFIKQIRAYMDGKQPVATTTTKQPGSASTPATRSDSKGFKKNKYGTLYKAEHATFTANTAIITRTTGPFTTCPQSGVLQAGQSITYDEVMKQNGYVWVAYTAYDGTRVYLPVRIWDKTTDSRGKLWGTIN